MAWWHAACPCHVRHSLSGSPSLPHRRPVTEGPATEGCSMVCWHGGGSQQTPPSSQPSACQCHCQGCRQWWGLFLGSVFGSPPHGVAGVGGRGQEGCHEQNSCLQRSNGRSCHTCWVGIQHGGWAYSFQPAQSPVWLWVGVGVCPVVEGHACNNSPTSHVPKQSQAIKVLLPSHKCHKPNVYPS